MVMGCYGIGVSRTMAAAIEQNHDENGIIWPVAIAPYEVLVVPMNAKDKESWDKAEEIYQQLKRAGVEVVIDDRNDAGVNLRCRFNRLSAESCCWPENFKQQPAGS